jgi:hypothetical protein
VEGLEVTHVLDTAAWVNNFLMPDVFPEPHSPFDQH